MATFRQKFALAIACTLAVLSIGTTSDASRQPAPTPYIVNGDVSESGAYPFFAQMFITINGHRWFNCGGSVVAPKVVLTAAHCVYQLRPTANVSIVVGSNGLDVGRRIRVVSWAKHSRYDPNTIRYDIALLRLAEPANVAPIKIVGPSSDYRWVTEGTPLKVIGMGCTEPEYDICMSDSGEPSPELREATVAKRSDVDCYFELLDWVDGDQKTTLCAGNSSVPAESHTSPNACYGDSGGPLMVDGPAGAPLLVGTVSWGAEDCGDYPVAYARLASMRAWLVSEGVPVDRKPFREGPAATIGDVAFPLAGEFNGDGISDIFWFGAGDATDRISLGSADGSFRSGPPANIGAATPPVIGDFNGDGRDDLLFYGPGPATDSLILSAFGGYIAGPPLTINVEGNPIAGDFNGDGRSDVVYFAAGSASAVLRLGTKAGGFKGGPAVAITPDYDGGPPGDFNGDGIDDILWYDPALGIDTMAYGRTDATFVPGPSFEFNADGYPLVADFTGEGRDDILFYSEDGEDLLFESRYNKRFTRGPEIVVTEPYWPFAGDFNGDNVGDVFWYGPSSLADKLWLGNRVTG